MLDNRSNPRPSAYRLLLGGSAIVGSLAYLASGAGATTFTAHFGPGNAQQFQIGGGNLESSLGAAVDLQLIFTNTDDKHGTWTATIKNVSGANPFGQQGVLTDFGLNLNSKFGWVIDTKDKAVTSFSSTAVSCLVDGCAYIEGSTNTTLLNEIGQFDSKGGTGFFSSVGTLLAATPALTAKSPDGKLTPEQAEAINGLAVGEQVTLQWAVLGAGFDKVTSLFDLVDSVPVGLTGKDDTKFDAFWVANFDDIGTGTTIIKDKLDTKDVKTIVVTGDTNLGGVDVLAEVPEPTTLAMFGAGLIGLAATRRRRRTK